MHSSVAGLMERSALITPFIQKFLVVVLPFSHSHHHNSMISYYISVHYPAIPGLSSPKYIRRQAHHETYASQYSFSPPVEFPIECAYSHIIIGRFMTGFLVIAISSSTIGYIRLMTSTYKGSSGLAYTQSSFFAGLTSSFTLKSISLVTIDASLRPIGLYKGFPAVLAPPRNEQDGLGHNLSAILTELHD